MHKKTPLICLLLCVFLSSAFILFEALLQTVETLQCQILVHGTDNFTLYTNTGKGYNEALAETVPVRGQEIWRLTQFQLRHTVFKSLRLDFDSAHGEVLIKQCRVQDKDGFPASPYHTISLKPLHQVQLESLAPYAYRATAQGEDPQLLLDIDWLRLFFGKIHPGFWFSFIFLLYPLCSWLLGFFRVSGTSTKAATAPPWQHKLYIRISLAVWLLAALAYWSAHSRHTVVNTPEQGDLLYGGPAFVVQEVDLHAPDGLTIHGRIYQSPNHVAQHGRILLLHGNFSDGQLHPLYPLMAESLANRGFLVLTIDFAGFGQSADRFAGEVRPESDQESETELALTYLKALPWQKNTISLIGHSMGANAALRVGLRNPDVNAMVLIGPPRRVEERFSSLLDLNYFYERMLATEKTLYSRTQPPVWYSLRDFQEEFLDKDMVYSLPALSGWCHKPVYFMDGGKESITDLTFLSRYIQKVSAPCAYVTMLDADHNFNVPAQADQVRYVPNNLQDAVEVLAKWCDQEETLTRRMWHTVENILRLLFPFRHPVFFVSPEEEDDRGIPGPF